MQEKAVRHAEALAVTGGASKGGTVPAVATTLQCPFLPRMCSSKQEMHGHVQGMHRAINEVTRCIGSGTCSVCGLLFEGVAGNAYKSEISKLNLLLRGPFLDETALTDTLADAASFHKQTREPVQVKLKPYVYVSELLVRSYQLFA